MSKITPVYYSELNDMTDNEVASFYYFYNLLDVSEIFHEGYADYEEKQIAVRNRVLADAYNSHEIPNHPRSNSSIIGISAIKNKPVLITEY